MNQTYNPEAKLKVTSKKGINPKKFAMWLAIGSFSLVFAGFTSAYIVQKSRGNWERFDLPSSFFIATVVILLSSLTMWQGVKAYKNNQRSRYNLLALTTLFLGIAFMGLQIFGFYQLYARNIKIDGNQSGSFVFVIAGVHLAHVFGGVMAILVTYISDLIKRRKGKNTLLGWELTATYWHYIDFLWLYLFVFFLTNR